MIDDFNIKHFFIIKNNFLFCLDVKTIFFILSDIECSILSNLKLLNLGYFKFAIDLIYLKWQSHLFILIIF